MTTKTSTAALAPIPLSLALACGAPLEEPGAHVEAPEAEPTVDDIEARQDSLLYDAMVSAKQNGFDAARRTHG